MSFSKKKKGYCLVELWKATVNHESSLESSYDDEGILVTNNELECFGSIYIGQRKGFDNLTKLYMVKRNKKPHNDA